MRNNKSRLEREKVEEDLTEEVMFKVSLQRGVGLR